MNRRLPGAMKRQVSEAMKRQLPSGLSTWAALASLVLVGACGGAEKKVQVSEVTAGHPAALSKLASGVAAAEDPDGTAAAIGHFRAALEVDPDLWEARYNLGVLLARRGELAPAEQELFAAERLAPNAEDVVVALAEVLRRRGAPTRALPSLERFVGQHPEALSARLAWVSCLRSAGRLDAAIEQASALLVRKADHAEALAELALAHLERGATDTAELLSKEALKADEKSAVAVRTAGLIALKQGDDAAAFRYFLRASELDPTDTTARLNMGTVLTHAGLYEQASTHFRAILEIESDNVAARLGLAAALRGQGSRERQEPLTKAEDLLKEILAREPENLAAHFNLAVLYADALAKPEAAKSHFEHFLRAAPKEHPARAEAEGRIARLAAGGALQQAPAGPTSNASSTKP